jgi:hypothetical protein
MPTCRVGQRWCWRRIDAGKLGAIGYDTVEGNRGLGDAMGDRVGPWSVVAIGLGGGLISKLVRFCFAFSGWAKFGCVSLVPDRWGGVGGWVGHPTGVMP